MDTLHQIASITHAYKQEMQQFYLEGVKEREELSAGMIRFSLSSG
jgi:hypothetical protein